MRVRCASFGAPPAFDRGRDLSFVERSRFVVEDGAWRYAQGTLVPASKLPSDPESLELAGFVSSVQRMGLSSTS